MRPNPTIEFVSQREQSRPADWPGEVVSLQQFYHLDQIAKEQTAPERRGAALGPRGLSE